MKFFKRIRGFLRRRIPFLPKKKKDNVTVTKNDFKEATENEVGQDVAEICNVALDAPMLSEKQAEDSKSCLISGNEVNFNDDVSKRSDENVESSPTATVNLDDTLPTKMLQEESKDNIGATINFKDEVEEQSTKVVNFHENSVVSAELFFPKHLDKDHEDHNCLSAERLKSCDDESEKAKENLEFFPQKIEIADKSSDQDGNSEFEVDFEKAFGPNIQELDEEDEWYHLSSKKIQNFVHSSEGKFDCQLAFVNEKEFNAEFDYSIIYRKYVSYPASEGFEYSDMNELCESLVGEIANVELDTSLTSVCGDSKENGTGDNKNDFDDDIKEKPDEFLKDDYCLPAQ